jgi:hypothetical protein
VFRRCLESYWRGFEAFYSHPCQDYQAEFQLAARRALDGTAYAVFQLRALHELEWSDCCRMLRVSKSDFHHLVYRMQSQLGRELWGRGLYPADEYFSRPIRRRDPRPAPAPPARRSVQLGSFRRLRAAA